MQDQATEVSKWFKGGAFTPPTVEELNRLIPSCEILEFVDRGGMGAVYRARQRSLNRIVAVKVLPPAHLERRSFAERFKRETEALGKLNHPHIVSIYDCGEAEGGLLYYVMEFVEGSNLLRRLEAGSLSPRQKLTAVMQICDALQDAHDKGVIHRDIKPSNILLDGSGNVKIADFGLAKVLREGEPEIMLTASGDALGTPEYVAPEVLNGKAPVDHRADIYSLGVMLYFMLTGHTPKGAWEPPSQCGADQRLDDVVTKALQHKPDDRYQRAHDMTGVLQDVLQQASGLIDTPPRQPEAQPRAVASSTAPTMRLNRGEGRGRAGKIIAIAAAVAALGGGALFIKDHNSADREQTPPPAAQPPFDPLVFAKWVFENGGLVNVTTDEQPSADAAIRRDITTVEDLPKQPFTIVRVNLRYNPAFDDALCHPLVLWCEKAGTVGNLCFKGTAITSAGLRDLPRLAGTLKNLDIQDTVALSPETLDIISKLELAYLRVSLRDARSLPADAVPDEELVKRLRAALPELLIEEAPSTRL